MLAAFTLVAAGPGVQAGTPGAYMNSAGYGKAVSAVTYGAGKTSATSAAMYYPCAAVNPTSAFTCVTSPVGLPEGTPSSVYCQSKGAPNYQWKVEAYVTGGATADNPELEARINLAPAPCASYSVESSAQFFDANSGLITVNAQVTTGAAIWLRGYEFLGGGTPSSLADLIANGALQWDMLMIGPFNLLQANCMPVSIPFQTQTGHANLYFVVDAVAKSVPFTVTCPGNLTFGCTDSVAYPPAVVTGGCGNVTVTYSPAPGQLPRGVSTVTATATDEVGNTAQCSFTATRSVLGFDGFYAPINGTGGSCNSPIRSINLGSNIPVKFSTTCDGSTFLGGSPTFSIRKCPSLETIGGGSFQSVSDIWHFNWDTTGLSKGTYQLTATLQDGSSQTAYVRLK